MKITCPVCNKDMQKTFHNQKMFICTRQKVYVPELEFEMETVHAIYYLNTNKTPTMKTIEVLPYIFEIHDTDEIKQTRIMKVIKRGTKPDIKSSAVRCGDQKIYRQALLVIPSAINCQWDDKQKVFDKVKTYMLFS